MRRPDFCTCSASPDGQTRCVWLSGRDIPVQEPINQDYLHGTYTPCSTDAIRRSRSPSLAGPSARHGTRKYTTCIPPPPAGSLSVSGCARIAVPGRPPEPSEENMSGTKTLPHLACSRGPRTRGAGDAKLSHDSRQFFHRATADYKPPPRFGRAAVQLAEGCMQPCTYVCTSEYLHPLPENDLNKREGQKNRFFWVLLHTATCDDRNRSLSLRSTCPPRIYPQHTSHICHPDPFISRSISPHPTNPKDNVGRGNTTSQLPAVLVS